MALLAGYIAAGVAVTWPLASYLRGRLPDIEDPASYVWSLWWVAHQITHLGNPWFTPRLAAPAGVQLGYDTLMPLLGLLMLPVTLLAGPALSYNLLVLVLPGAACYALYRVARLWLPSAVGAVAAGALFGLSTMVTFQDWFHLNIAAGTVFLPLALEASVRLRRRPGIPRALRAGVVLGLAVLVNQESAIMAAILVVLALGPWLASRPSLDRLRDCGVVALAAFVVASPQIAAMAWQSGSGGDRRSRQPVAGLVPPARGRTAHPVLPVSAAALLGTRLPGQRLPLSADRRGADVRGHADRARAGGPGDLLAAAQRPAAGPALAGQRGAGHGLGAEDRHHQLPARRGQPWAGPAVRRHALHLAGARARPVRVPRGGPVHPARAGARRPAGREHVGWLATGARPLLGRAAPASQARPAEFRPVRVQASAGLAGPARAGRTPARPVQAVPRSPGAGPCWPARCC